jgi:prephenate dehydrogenase
VRWGKVTIIGVGLLGGSIGLALKHRKLARQVYGYVRRRSAVRECLEARAVDAAGQELLPAVEGADLIVVCTPISEIVPLSLALRPALKPGALVTDVGSVKSLMVRKLGSPVRQAGAQFVGSHPMAGSSRGGVRCASSDLFQDAVSVITPDDLTSQKAIRQATAFWHALGARVLKMKAALHDRLVSRASHLPHMVASVLASQVLDPRQDRRQAQLCSSGFRDTTRVAAGSPAIWRDIAMANRLNLVRDLKEFEHSLAAFRQSLEREDAAAVSALLMSAQQRRLEWRGERTSMEGE